MSAAKNGKKPTNKEQEPRTYVQVETGIYRYKNLNDEISHHERPWIIGRNGQPVRTYRALGFNFTKQQNLNNARTEYNRRRTEVAAGRNPYEEKQAGVQTRKGNGRKDHSHLRRSQFPGPLPQAPHRPNPGRGKIQLRNAARVLRARPTVAQ